MMAGQKSIPLTCLAIHVIFQKNRVRRFLWLSAQRHVRFFGRVVAFLGVALLAGRYQVYPCIATTAGARGNMIDGKLLLGAAILALVVVALKYILPGKINALVRGVNISVESYN